MLATDCSNLLVSSTISHLKSSGQTNVGIEAHLARSTSATLEIDIDLFDKSTSISGVHVEGLVLKAVAEPLPSDDRILFAKTVWAPSVSYGFPTLEPAEPGPEELVYIDAVERTAPVLDPGEIDRDALELSKARHPLLDRDGTIVPDRNEAHGLRPAFVDVAALRHARHHDRARSAQNGPLMDVAERPIVEAGGVKVSFAAG